MRTAIACLLGALIAPALLLADPPAPPQSSSPVIAGFLTTPDERLTSYRALRTLEAASRGGNMRAQMTAWTSLDPEHGFSYAIVSESGSGAIRQRVLKAALEAERSMTNGGELDRGALTPANYDFSDTGTMRDGLVRIALAPRRRDTALVDGSMFLVPDSADLVSVEGRLVKRPSFWTRRVDVVRRYARVNAVRVPLGLWSTAQVLIVGESTFSMTYEYHAINGRAVVRGDAASE